MQEVLGHGHLEPAAVDRLAVQEAVREQGGLEGFFVEELEAVPTGDGAVGIAHRHGGVVRPDLFYQQGLGLGLAEQGKGGEVENLDDLLCQAGLVQSLQVFAQDGLLPLEKAGQDGDRDWSPEKGQGGLVQVEALEEALGQHALGVAAPLGHGFLAFIQDPLQHFEELVLVHGLEQVVVHAEAEGRPGVFELGVAGEDADAGAEVLLPDAGDQVQAGHFRHGYVGDEELVAGHLQLLQGLAAGKGHVYGFQGERELADHVGDPLGDHLFVVHH